MLHRLIVPSFMALCLLAAQPALAGSVLTVDGQSVTAEEVAARLQLPTGQRFDALPVEVQGRILQSLAVHLHLLKQAEAQYGDDAEVKKAIETARANAPAPMKPYAHEPILLQHLRDGVMKERNNPQALEAAIAEAKQRRSGEEYDLRFLSFPEKAQALEAAAKAKDAAGFEALSPTVMGYVNPNQLPKAVEDAVTPLKKGELSAPVQTDFGWQLFAVKDRRGKKVELTEADRNEIKASLENRLWLDYVGEQMEKADIRLNPTSPQPAK